MAATRLAGYVIEYGSMPGCKITPAYLGLSADLVLGTLCYSPETAFQFGSLGQAHQFLTRFPRFDGYAPGTVREVHEVTGLNLGRCVGPDGKPVYGDVPLSVGIARAYGTPTPAAPVSPSQSAADRLKAIGAIPCETRGDAV